MPQVKPIDLAVLEPLEITAWRRRRAEEVAQEIRDDAAGRAEAERKRKKAKRAKRETDAKLARLAKGKKGAKGKRKDPARPRKQAPWPEIASTVGVYGLLHRPTNSIYIGMTADKNGFKWRWKRHKAQLFVARTHHCTILQDFVNEHGLRPRDFDLVVFSSYPARPRTQKLCNHILKEEVVFWDRAQEAGFTMLCERPLGVKRKYERVGKHD